jgi:hypothetical protein
MGCARKHFAGENLSQLLGIPPSHVVIALDALSLIEDGTGTLTWDSLDELNVGTLAELVSRLKREQLERAKRNIDAGLPIPEMKVEEPSREQPKPKIVAAEEFITRWPLYTPAPVDDFVAPPRISFHCNLPICHKETTWLLMGDPQYVGLEGTSKGWFKWLWYACGLCNKNYLLIFYRETDTQRQLVKRAVGGNSIKTKITKIQKLGQYPALSLDIPKGLEKNLGAEAISLYKKALANRNEGFGLDAVTYIRRVVEDKTNELIEVAAQLAESHNVNAKIVAQIRAAATERTTYDKKLKIAATVIPEALLIEGVNPLAELYSLVSEGVHALSEEQCIAVADETTSVFEFVFTNLRANTTTRHDFVDKVKKWAARHSPEKSIQPTDTSDTENRETTSH